MGLVASHQINGLTTAIESRHRIGIAQGLVMHECGLDADQSFRVPLRVAS